MATSPYKFGIFFPEHTGFLYMEKLAPGNEGGVSLTCSITDKKQYVRKKTHANDRENAEAQVPEVQFHRNHPLIPSLIWSQDQTVLYIDHDDHDTLKSTVMYAKFCNGGTLNQLCLFFAYNENQHLPEALIWRMLDQRVQTLLYLHHEQGGLTRLDNHLSNVFLHYEEGSKLPDFYTGDLGHVRPINPVIWEDTATYTSNTPSNFRKIKALDLPNRGMFDDGPRAPYNGDVEALSHDVTNIWYGLVSLMYRIDLEEVYPNDERDESRERGDWSSELYECEERLEAITQFFDKGQTTRYNDLENLGIEIARISKLAADADPDADVRIARKAVGTDCYEEDFDHDYKNDETYRPNLERYRAAHSNPGEPALFDSRTHLLQLARRWPEPWRIARVDESTGQVLGVEKMSFSLSPLKLKEDARGNDDPRNPYLAPSTSLKIGVERILAAAAVADTTTHRVQEDFTLAAFPRGPTDDPNEDDIFGLDPAWTAERLAGPERLKPIKVEEEDASVMVMDYPLHPTSPTLGRSEGNPIVIDDDDDDAMEVDNSEENPIAIDDDSDDDHMEIDG